MKLSNCHDAVVVGSGPNGLAAAITLARAGLSVLVLEASATPGGGAKTESLTLPGFSHDVCSSIHPLAVGSPFFRSLRLDVEWIQPEFDVAHPLGGERAAWLNRSLAASADNMGPDAPAYRRMLEPLATRWEALLEDVLQPLLRVPRHPWLMARFGLNALQSAGGLARRVFSTDAVRALFAGLAAHSFLPLRETASAATGLVLAVLAHGVGWPMPRGGAGKITESMLSILRGLGGQIETGRRIINIDQLPPARAVLFDVSPRQLLAIAGHKFPSCYAAALRRYRYGPGVFKIDYALNAPIPWTASPCRTAGTVHVGGTLEEIETSEQQAAGGVIPERPFVLVAQHSVFDPTRAPAGKHTAWVYCHVPHGCNADMTDRIEAQMERYAPGFRDCVLARATQNCHALEERNANLIGGDIAGGLANLRQLIARPVLTPLPWRTPVRGLYICSASTPPGGGVHGMCGYNAARHALRTIFGIKKEEMR
jgi:phytoene dehydrogenase-like protein